MDLSKYVKKLSALKISPLLKKNLPIVAFILIIPLGILVGYLFSNMKNTATGGLSRFLTPVYKLLYVARVDGAGIPKSEWEKTLKARYGMNAARELIEIYTVRNELKKAGISVSEEEINNEIADIEKQLAGQDLEEILAQQGRNLTDFRKDVSLQVGMKKLLSDKVTVSEEEVNTFLQSAGESIQGNTNEEKLETAKKMLTDQKLGEEISKWFSEIQAKVKVDNYLESK